MRRLGPGTLVASAIGLALTLAPVRALADDCEVAARPVSVVRTEMSGRYDAYRKLVAHWYSHFLGRPTCVAALERSSELNWWVRILGQGTHPATVLANILSSPEYALRSGESDSGLIERVLRDLEGPTVTAAAIERWVARLARAPVEARLESVREAILQSSEFRDLLVALWLDGLVGDGNGLAATRLLPEVVEWSQLLATGRHPLDVQCLLFGSPEIWTRAGGTPAGFVGLLYRQIVGREASAPELAAGVAELAQGRARESLALVLLTSEAGLRREVERWRRFIGTGDDRVLSAERVARAVAGLQAGLHPNDVLIDLLKDLDFLSGPTDAIVIEELYRRLLLRGLDPTSIPFYGPRIESHTQARRIAVLRELLESDDARSSRHLGWEDAESVDDAAAERFRVVLPSQTF